jgi:hypothetical protein
MGPEGYQQDDIYLRTAISVGAEGWAHFDYVKMPEYRWGIFLVEPEPERKIHFGDPVGEPAWNVVPGELRRLLRCLAIVSAPLAGGAAPLAGGAARSPSAPGAVPLHTEKLPVS